MIVRKLVGLMALLILSAFSAAGHSAEEPDVIQSVTFRVKAGLTRSHEWRLHVPREGDAELVWGHLLDTPKKDLPKELTRVEAKIRVWEEKRKLLFDELAKLDLDTLRDEYGDTTVDMNNRWITVSTTQTNKTINLRNLTNWLQPRHKHHALLEEVVPLLEVWDMAFRLFVEPRLIHFLNMDEAVLKRFSK